MKRNVLGVAVFFAGAAAVLASNGTWLSSTVGGEWSSIDSWVDGVIAGNGGVATFSMSAGGQTITSSMSPSLSGFSVSVSGGQDLKFASGTFYMTPSATLFVSSGIAVFENAVISTSDDLIISGEPNARYQFNTAQQIAGRLKLVNGWLRATDDSCLGPALSSYVADAIVMDGGTLQNNSSEGLQVAANRGITVTGNGGYFEAGFINSKIEILSPIVGPGSVMFNYEFSPAILSNPANSYAGDTVIGAFGSGFNAGNDVTVKLGASEVIPHGPGTGILRIAPYSTDYNSEGYLNQSRAPRGILELNGFTETVNAVSTGTRPVVRSSAPGGKLILAGDSDSDFSGLLEAGVTIEKRGSGALRMLGGTISGEIVLKEGTLAAGAEVFQRAGVLTVAGGALTFTAPSGVYEWNGTVESGLYGYPYYGSLKIENRGTRSYRARWYVTEAGTYSFLKSYKGGAELVIDSATIIQDTNPNAYLVVKDVAISAGWHDVSITFSNPDNQDFGASLKNGIMYDEQNGSFTTDEERIRAKMFTDNSGPNLRASGHQSVFSGTLNAETDVTVTVDDTVSALQIAGEITTDPDDPHTVTFQMANGGPLTIGNSYGDTPALITAPIRCESGIVLTDSVWFLNEVPENMTVTPGTILTLDYPGAVANDITLDTFSLRIHDPAVGNGTITVNEGQILRFDTIDLIDGVEVDSPDNPPRTFANNIILNGGELVFTGTGQITMTGTITGTGTVNTSGSGTVTFLGTSTTTPATVYSFKGGVCRFTEASLGDACLWTADGIFANVAGENLTVETNLIRADSGGIQVDGANAVMTISSEIEGRRPISKWGDGILRLTGTTSHSGNLMIHGRGGTLELAKEGDASAVSSIIGIEPGVTVRLAGEGGNQIAERLSVSGGTFDMNGRNETVTILTGSNANSLITNTGMAPAVLTIESGESGSFRGTVSDGNGGLTLVKRGSGVQTLSETVLANSGLDVQEGGTVCSGPATVSARYLRFLCSVSRPGTEAGGPNWYNTGFQFSEFQLMLGGNPVAWPAGTTSTASIPGSGNETAAKIIDGDLSTKWYCNSLGTPCIIDMGETVAFDGYRWATANDAPGRDPYNWTLEIGIDADGDIQWRTIDTRAGFLSTTNRRTWNTPDFSVSASRSDFVPVDYPITVAAGASLTILGAQETLENLQAAGTLFLDDAEVSITGNSTLTGKVSGEGILRLQSDQSVLGGFVADSLGVTIVNDGVDAEYLISGSGYSQLSASLQDGAGQLGLHVEGDVDLLLNGRNNTYTGETVIEGGTVSVCAVQTARFIRFTGLKTKGNTANNFQLSEFDLMMGETKVEWPAGTTVSFPATIGKAGEGPEMIIDGNVGTKIYYPGSIMPLTISMGATVAFDGYRWFTANDMPVRDFVSWTVEISSDGTTWTEIDRQEDVPVTDDRQSLAFAGSFVAPDTGIHTIPIVRFVRFNAIKTKGNATSNFQLSEFELLFNGERVAWPEGSAVQYDQTITNFGEAPEKLIDGSVDTKFYFGGGVGAMTFELGSPMPIDGYQWYTANDASFRDLVSWSLEISEDGTTWTEVDRQEDVSITEDRKVVAFSKVFVTEGRVSNALSDASKIALMGGNLVINDVAETVRSLSGSGNLTLTGEGKVIFSPSEGDREFFSGKINGIGSLVMNGQGTQALGGNIGMIGTLTVKNGTLDITGADLGGISEIVLWGGRLIGTASTTTDLKVTSRGGVYSASISVGGTLTLDGAPVLDIDPESGKSTLLCFRFGNASEETRANFLNATCARELPPILSFMPRIAGSDMILSIAPSGTLMIVR
ncbi:MAG: discoidin domain-containing protein [Kiritimatiellae bacterium]|nr:discoidin domain-containing protein [Kiritimatiellia bacterium]